MQRVDPVSAIAQALDVKFKDLARGHTRLDPAALGMLSKEVLVLGIEADRKGNAVIALGHWETPFAAASVFMRFRYEQVNNSYKNDC